MFDSGRSYFLGRSHIRLAPKINSKIIFTQLVTKKRLIEFVQYFTNNYIELLSI